MDSWNFISKRTQGIWSQTSGFKLWLSYLSWANGLPSQSPSVFVFKTGLIIILASHLLNELLWGSSSITCEKPFINCYFLVKHKVISWTIRKTSQKLINPLIYLIKNTTLPIKIALQRTAIIICPGDGKSFWPVQEYILRLLYFLTFCWFYYLLSIIYLMVIGKISK